MFFERTFLQQSNNDKDESVSFNTTEALGPLKPFKLNNHLIVGISIVC